MANSIPEIFVARELDAAKMSRLALASVLLMLLVACNRPSMPPTPVVPSKPKMQSGMQMEAVHQAIFNYARPASKASSSLEPEPEEGKCGRLQV
ncbi:hypothetical protein [Noviherbaspirillum sedimenti]|uniref:Uncharacterized protein n=1 Tax=Noviherbaspirillum sedimenti TaxID=2320865 RepID=A0A3A3GDA4_9BURK|nr:hypothetical protein [Noviherbaspirillum sedimenti]RJG01584.1 hypothetical protein D3878_08290 [Noviherbaspirillum sedimenti]RJG08194.1 hypothetical protein D3878_00040 [Noviherbaspirillum sedimenti]RJG08195.1 hypothetical protein D3878_00055 [Noviherbaspirillum sedimenti]